MFAECFTAEPFPMRYVRLSLSFFFFFFFFFFLASFCFSRSACRAVLLLCRFLRHRCLRLRHLIFYFFDIFFLLHACFIIFISFDAFMFDIA